MDRKRREESGKGQRRKKNLKEGGRRHLQESEERQERETKGQLGTGVKALELPLRSRLTGHWVHPGPPIP